MPLSWLDVLLIVIMLLSGMLAMLRGLTREVLTIMAWAAAALATLFLWPEYKGLAAQYIQPAILAEIVLAASIFIFVLIVVSFIAVYLGDHILDAQVGPLDRAMGFVFGLARGLVLVVILYLFLDKLIAKEYHPPWIKQARSLPIIEQTGEAILSILPSILPENPGDLLPGRDKVPEDKQSSNIRPQKSENQTVSGYGASERRGLNQLMESTREQRN